MHPYISIIFQGKRILPFFLYKNHVFLKLTNLHLLKPSSFFPVNLMCCQSKHKIFINIGLTQRYETEIRLSYWPMMGMKKDIFDIYITPNYQWAISQLLAVTRDQRWYRLYLSKVEMNVQAIAGSRQWGQIINSDIAMINSFLYKSFKCLTILLSTYFQFFL
jgi:hypothetical protein